MFEIRARNLKWRALWLYFIIIKGDLGRDEASSLKLTIPLLHLMNISVSNKHTRPVERELINISIA